MVIRDMLAEVCPAGKTLVIGKLCEKTLERLLPEASIFRVTSLGWALFRDTTKTRVEPSLTSREETVPSPTLNERSEPVVGGFSEVVSNLEIIQEDRRRIVDIKIIVLNNEIFIYVPFSLLT